MRNLTFGDRTISYDTGLNFVENEGPIASSRFQHSIIDGDDTKQHIQYSEADSGAGSDCSEEHEDESQKVKDKRQSIKPDMIAMSQLLNFDEEDEDDLTDSDDITNASDNDEAVNKTKWKKVMVKDLTQIQSNGKQISRRHSITICDKSKNKSEKSDNKTSPKSGEHMSLPYGRSGTGEMDLDHGDYQDKTGLATINLNLDEVAHIRSVLTRAELEALPLDGTLKTDMEQGLICFICMNTRFGIFRRGQKCQICKQCICSKCFTKMRIPVEHFNAIPVNVLSPVPPLSPTQSTTPFSSIFSTHLTNCAGSAPNSPKTRRHKTPAINQLNVTQLKDKLDLLPTTTRPNIQHQGQSNTPPLPVTSSWRPLSGSSTLPSKKSGRRWSVLESVRSADREKLEGSLLSVCFDCKQMVLQVIRTKGISRRSRQKTMQEDGTRS